MSPLRVVQCIASMHEAAAGTTAYLQQLTMLLAQAGIDSPILTTGTAAPDVAARYFPTDASRLAPVAAMRPSGPLYAALRDAAATTDILHNHGLWLLPNVYPGLVARRSGTPLLVSPHGMLGRGALRFSAYKKRAFWHLFQRRGVAAAACWHATSTKEAEDIRAFGIRKPIAIVPIGIDVPPPEAIDRRREVLFLGRLHPKKGLDSLLRVWPAVAARHPDWTLRIVGPLDDEHGRRYRQQASDLPAIRFDDAVYGETKLRIYRQAGLFVLPTQDENFGITVTEALAAGTPVVCSDGAPWSGLIDAGAGWWVAQRDEALRAALDEAIALPDAVRHAMGVRGREWMLRSFAWPPVTQQMIDLYAWLAGRGDRPDFVSSD